MRIHLAGLLVAMTGAVGGCASGPLLDIPEGSLLIGRYHSFAVEAAKNDAAKTPPRGLIEGLADRLKEALGRRGIPLAGARVADNSKALLRTSVISCVPMEPSAPDGKAPRGDECLVRAELFDGATARRLVRFVTRVAHPGERAPDDAEPAGPAMARSAARFIADEIARLQSVGGASQPRDKTVSDRFSVMGAAFARRGSGEFSETSPAPGRATIDLKAIRHAYDPVQDRDVPVLTNVTLNDRNGPRTDARGRAYAVLTLYDIDPPLEDLASREKGVDRGMDFRDPSNMVKGAYSNYVSPVFTDDRDRRPVAGHPIGHFYVKLQVPGYPTILTGMTTTKRADAELVDLTLGRQLGIGGVLMTPQPGRLNAAGEVADELSLRQRPLVVIDGVRYKRVLGRNVGPTYRIEDGNVTFARFRIPVSNGKDALRFFLEYVRRGVHNTFGGLANRPNRGTGAGCSAFAMAWLKAAGVIPMVDEAGIAPYLDRKAAANGAAAPFWTKFYRRISIPWDHMGCDERLKAARIRPANYTLYDLLFHGVSNREIVAASAGLAEHMKKDIGELGATLFEFGAFTPLRTLFINMKRKDPVDRGNYNWARPGQGLSIGFWDNSLFSDWVKSVWRDNEDPRRFKPVREGRFRGVEVDAMDTPRQTARFFRRADEIAAKIKRLKERGVAPTTCQALFALGIQ